MRRTVETIVATILVPGAADVLIPYFILSQTGASIPARLGLAEALALTVGVVGASLVLWVSHAFVTKGHGTPIPIDPPRQFVAVGLFRYVRNPMYLGTLLILAAEAVLFRSLWVLWYGIGLWGVLHVLLFVIEEPQLERRFGDTYREYLRSTPRWIPRASWPPEVREARRE